MSLALQPGDIFLTRGHGFFSGAIRYFSRRCGEAKTEVNHAGIIAVGGSIREALIIESLARGAVRRGLWQAYGPPHKDALAIYRARNLTAGHVASIVARAEFYVGRPYGGLKIVAHLGDWFLGGAYVFRRLARLDRYPICSWVVAQAYAAAGKHFGVAPGAASPDDIWDFVTTHPDIYDPIWPLQPLEAGGQRTEAGDQRPEAGSRKPEARCSDVRLGRFWDLARDRHAGHPSARVGADAAAGPSRADMSGSRGHSALGGRGLGRAARLPIASHCLSASLCALCDPSRLIHSLSAPSELNPNPQP